MDRKTSRLKQFIEWGRANANPKAREYVRRAVMAAERGEDRRAFASLFDELTPEEVVGFTLEMYRVRAPVHLYRYFLRWLWIAWWYRLFADVGIEKTIEMFRYADFPLPREIGPTVKAYRGTRGIDAWSSAATGMSWSLNRDQACGFAFRDPLGMATGEPLVIEAEIPREQILMYSSIGHFNEITVAPILTNPAITFRVSRPVDDWHEGYQLEQPPERPDTVSHLQ